MPQLLGDDPDINAFRPQFCSVRMSEAVSMHTLGDPGLTSQAGKKHANVAILEGLAVKQAEDRISPVDAVVGSNLKPSNESVERLAIHPHSP